MSREVLGARVDDGPADVAGTALGTSVLHDPGSGATALGAAGRARRGGSQPVGPEAAEQARPGPTPATVPGDPSAPGRTTSRLPGRRGLVAAAVVGALVGGLLAVGAVQRSELRDAQSVATVHAWVEPAAGRGSADAIALTVRVVNTGGAPVTVIGAAMNGGLPQAGPVRVVLTEDVVVRPDSMASAPMDAQADCDGPPLAEGSASDGRLQLRVRTDDGREQLVQPPTGGISLTSADVQEAFCGQTGLRLGLSVAAIQTRPGGDLSMSLLNDSPQSLSLDFSAPDGTRIVADQDLPITVESGRRFSLIVRLEVDNCTADAQRVQAGDQVQLVIDGRPRRGGLDDALVGAWVAREVALACSG